MSTELLISDIIRDTRLQSRVALHEPTVETYRELIQTEGKTLPPVTVYQTGELIHLVDGFHRVEAAKRAGKTHILANLRPGNFREAILFSVGANANHGLPRSNADKRKAVLVLLQDTEWSTWSDRDIANKTGTTHPFVGKVRKELADGTVETVTTPTLFERPAPAAPALDWPASGKERVAWILACSELSLINLALQQPNANNEVYELRQHRDSLELLARLTSLSELLNWTRTLLGNEWPAKSKKPGLETAFLRRLWELAEPGPLAFDPAAALRTVRNQKEAAFYLQYQEIPPEIRLELLKVYRLDEDATRLTVAGILKQKLPAGFRAALLVQQQQWEEEAREERAQTQLPRPETRWDWGRRVAALLSEDAFLEEVIRKPEWAEQFYDSWIPMSRERWDQLGLALERAGYNLAPCPDPRCEGLLVPENHGCPRCHNRPHQAEEAWRNDQNKAWRTLLAAGVAEPLHQLLEFLQRETVFAFCPVCAEDGHRHSDDCCAILLLPLLPLLERVVGEQEALSTPEETEEEVE